MGEIKDPAITLLQATGAGAGSGVSMKNTKSTFQATADGSHTGTTSIAIEVSNDNNQWIVMGTISVTGNDDSDGFAVDAAWRLVRANCTAHGDSTNTVTVTMGG